MNRVSDDNNLRNIKLGYGLIDAASNSKHLSFCASYECSMMDSLDKRLIGDVCVRDRCSDVVFDATIVVDWEEKALITIESSCWIQDLLLFSFIHKLKENLSEKVLIIREPGVSSKWVGEKARNRPCFDFLSLMAI